MRAVQCLDYGQPLRISEVDDPKPRDGQVCIDVEASGVNYVDALIVRGEYQIKPQTPFVAGSEVAGRVYAVGQGVEDLAVGDRVFSMTGFGGFAERVGQHARAPIHNGGDARVAGPQVDPDCRPFAHPASPGLRTLYALETPSAAGASVLT